MNGNVGWVCPSCNRGVRPDEKTCDHGGGLAAISLPSLPGHYLSPPMPWPSTPMGPITCGDASVTCINPFQFTN